LLENSPPACTTSLKSVFFKLFYCRGDPHNPLLLNKTDCTDIYKERKEREKTESNYTRLSSHNDRESATEFFTLYLRRVT
jgi:hypothetical protein